MRSTADALFTWGEKQQFGKLLEFIYIGKHLPQVAAGWGKPSVLVIIQECIVVRSIREALIFIHVKLIYF